MDMSVCIHPFYLPSLHSILRDTKQRSVMQFRFPCLWQFLCHTHFPTVFVRCPLSCSFQCHVHVAIVYTLSISGISWVSSLHWMCNVHRHVWPCTSVLIFQLGCLRPRILRCGCSPMSVKCRLFQLCVICGHNTLMFYLVSGILDATRLVSSVSTVHYMPALYTNVLHGAGILAVSCQMSVRCRLFQLCVTGGRLHCASGGWGCSSFTVSVNVYLRLTHMFFCQYTSMQHIVSVYI